MARQTLEALPQELIISILEWTCWLVVKELTTLTFTRRVPYGTVLNQVTHLQLVSNSFSYHFDTLCQGRWNARCKETTWFADAEIHKLHRKCRHLGKTSTSAKRMVRDCGNQEHLREGMEESNLA